jgi:ATP adenylyltransferase
MSLYYLGNSRTEEQSAEMRRLESAGICLFCPKHLSVDAEHPALLKTAHWTVVNNRYPYKGTRQHLLLIPDAHVSDLVDLPPESHHDFWDVLSWVRDHYTMTYYGLGVRNGDNRFTGGSIWHVHVHVVVGDVNDPAHGPVRMKLSSRPDPV